MKDTNWRLTKRSTGIAGLDQLTHGGFPRGQATLILGGAGAGKTVLTLQILSNAVAGGQSGVFVTFEESPAQLYRNADSFSWGKVLTESDAWSVIDARISNGLEIAGGFDIEGLVAVINSRVQQHDEPWIIVDGIDQLFQYQPDPRTAIEQIGQLNEHCEKYGWTLLLTGKDDDAGLSARHLEGIEFMLPTMVFLSARLIDRRLNRFLRVAKYRGSDHVTDQVSMVMNHEGVHLPYVTSGVKGSAYADDERISTGIERLDQVLGGGLYRGSSLLISGRPGTAKSTIAANIARASADRGERALLISFDEMEAPYVRNLSSVGINLQPHIEADLVRFLGLSAAGSLVSEHLLQLRSSIEDFGPQCLVIDPVSALFKAPSTEGAPAAIECLLEMTRVQGITTVMTALSNQSDPEGESALGNVSTIADSWIVLDYNVRAGERNRSLSVVKSRGTAHSNQQREILLSNKGVDLADVYEFGTEVLMGTARIQKQRELQAEQRRVSAERVKRRQDIEHQIEEAQTEMDRLKTELKLEELEYQGAIKNDHHYAEEIVRRRQSDGERRGKEK